jgi:apolipoprotein N-acyltransferase
VVGYTRVDNTGAAPRKYNSAAFVDPKDGFLGSYDKIGLVPWTEFTPIEGLTSRKSAKFSHGSNYPVFELRSRANGKRYRFGSAICYDVAFPRLFQRYMRAAAAPPDLFLVCSSESSDKTGRMARHVLGFTKMRAIECRRALVRNVRFGYSGIIDATGRLRNESLPPVIESPTPLGGIPIDRRSTLYMWWGDWIPAGVACVVLLAVAARLYSLFIIAPDRSQMTAQNAMGSS